MTADAELFTCLRHTGNLRLTPAACAGMWRRGRRAGPIDLVHKCRGCPIGARNAGIKEAEIESTLTSDQIAAAGTCIRCGKPSQRLIGRTLCVSCFNRCSEWLRGYNAKGTFPNRATPLMRFKSVVTLRNTRGTLSAFVSTLWEFIAVTYRHFPEAPVLDWPAITVTQSNPFLRTDVHSLPRPYFPYFSKGEFNVQI